MTLIKRNYRILILCVFPITLILAIAITTHINNNKLNNFANQIFNYALPPNSATVKKITFRASTKINIEYTALMMIKSDQDLNYIQEYYDRVELKPVNKENKMPNVEISELSDKISILFYKKLKSFFYKDYEDNSPYSRYYLIKIEDYDTFTLFDLDIYK